MLDLCAYFTGRHRPLDSGRHRATAGWLLAQRDLGGELDLYNPNDIRRSFATGDLCKITTSDNIIICQPPVFFKKNDYQTVANRISQLICENVEDALGTFRSCLIEILQNVVQHSTCEGGYVSVVRTNYYASMVVMDKGCGFKESFSRAFQEINTDRFPRETWDQIALEWALLNEITSSAERDAENAGMGLPRLLHAAAATCVISGRAGIFKAPRVRNLPKYYAESIRDRYPQGRHDHRRCDISPERGHGGVIVEAFFDLRSLRRINEVGIPEVAPETTFNSLRMTYGERCALALLGRYGA